MGLPRLSVVQRFPPLRAALQWPGPYPATWRVTCWRSVFFPCYCQPREDKDPDSINIWPVSKLIPSQRARLGALVRSLPCSPGPMVPAVASLLPAVPPHPWVLPASRDRGSALSSHVPPLGSLLYHADWPPRPLCPRLWPCWPGPSLAHPFSGLWRVTCLTSESLAQGWRQRSAL